MKTLQNKKLFFEIFNFCWISRDLFPKEGEFISIFLYVFFWESSQKESDRVCALFMCSAESTTTNTKLNRNFCTNTIWQQAREHEYAHLHYTRSLSLSMYTPTHSHGHTLSPIPLYSDATWGYHIAHTARFQSLVILIAVWKFTSIWVIDDSKERAFTCWSISNQWEFNLRMSLFDDSSMFSFFKQMNA